MKKTITSIIYFIFLMGCTDNGDILSPTDAMNYRKIAYNSLSETDKESIIINWWEANIEPGKYKKVDNTHTIQTKQEYTIYFMLIDTNLKLLDNQDLIAVSFKTTYDALLGPITSIVEPRSEKVIGYVGRL